MFLTAQRVRLRLQAFAFSSSAAEKVPIPQFKGPTGPASMIDSLEKRTRVLKGGEEGGQNKAAAVRLHRTQASMTESSTGGETGEVRSNRTGFRAEMDQT